MEGGGGRFAELIMQSDTAATLMRDPTVDSGGRWQIKKMTVLYSLIPAASETHILHALISRNICPAAPSPWSTIKVLWKILMQDSKAFGYGATNAWSGQGRSLGEMGRLPTGMLVLTQYLTDPLCLDSSQCT